MNTALMNNALMNTAFPAITIGIMTHNYGRYICEAIDSVLAQSRNDWELIIADDASADGTEQIVAPYLSDPRITYVRHAANLGQAGSWSFLLSQGTAPIIAVLHADDSWLPGTLDLALSAFAAEPELDLFYGNWWRQTEGQPERVLAKQENPHTFSGLKEYRYQTKAFTCLASAAFLTRRVAEAAGKPNSELKMVVDYEYFLRVCVHCRKAQASAEALTLYRVHKCSTTAESMSSGLFTQERKRLVYLCSLWADSAPLRSGLRALRYGMAHAAFSEGITHVVHGDVTKGLALMRQALAFGPVLLFSPKVLADYALCFCGKAGVCLLRRLHGARMAGLKNWARQEN